MATNDSTIENGAIAFLILDNTTSSNATTSPPPPWQKDFVGAFYFFLATPSFALHILVYLAVLKTQGGCRQLSPFYILLTNHYLADILKTLFFILYACPCIWAQSQVYGSAFGDFLGEFESVDYCAVLFSTFFMSANRALAVGAPELNEKVFTKKLALVYNCMTWIGGAAVSLINRLLSCRTVLLEAKFAFSTVCVQKPAASPGSIIVYIFAYGVVVFYLFALFALAKQGKNLDDSRVAQNIKGYQIRLFLQALGIWMGVVGNAIGKRSLSNCHD